MLTLLQQIFIHIIALMFTPVLFMLNINYIAMEECFGAYHFLRFDPHFDANFSKGTTFSIKCGRMVHITLILNHEITQGIVLYVCFLSFA